MTDTYTRPIPVPTDGVPRKLDAGWFVAFSVIAPNHDAAAIQGRIQATVRGYRYVDVARVDYQGEVDVDPQTRIRQGRWTVELAIEEPRDAGFGLG